jgi:hypothetical protein
MATREELEAKYGTREAPKPRAAAPAVQAKPKVQPKPVQPAAPPEPPATAPAAPPEPPLEVNQALELPEPGGGLSYAQAVRALMSSPKAGAPKVRSWDNPTEEVDTTFDPTRELGFDPTDVADQARSAVMERLKRARDAVPTPDDLLQYGKE